VFFFLIGCLLVFAKPFVILLLTVKWLPAVPFLQIVCITVSFYPIHAINSAAITSIGHSGIYLKIELIKKSLSMLLIVLCIPFGVLTMVAAGAVSSFLSTFISSWPNKRLIAYSSFEQWKDVLPSLLLSIISAAVAWPIHNLELNNIMTILMQLLTGTLVFIGGALIMKFQFVTEFKQIFIRSSKVKLPVSEL